MTGGFPVSIRFGKMSFSPVTSTTCAEIYSYAEAKHYGETGQRVAMGSVDLSNKKQSRSAMKSRKERYE